MCQNSYQVKNFKNWVIIYKRKPGKQWFYCILNFKQQENEGVEELFEPKILFEVDSKLNNIHLNIQV